ncbi:MAG: phosphoglycerate kinase [Alphaproteobacteria bacterium]|nr:phosphoglycerate kinase [Alphaproteobacteria bacterium]
MANLPLFSLEDVKNKRVLVRVDFNVPVQKNHVTDITRLVAVLPTLRELIMAQAKIILLSHRGRPRGKIDLDLSLRGVADALKDILERPVAFCSEAVGKTAKEAVDKLKAGEILLLENLRFYPGEENNDPGFVKQLAELGEVYINDGFAVSHRAHGSVVGLPKHLPSFAGLLLDKEVRSLASALEPKAQPITAIIGGAKISTKIALLESLVTKVRNLVVGGGIANTFLLALKHDIGNSLCERDQVPMARKIIKQAEKSKCKLIIPHDIRASRDLNANSEVYHIPVADLQKSESIFDIGPKTAERVGECLQHSRTVIWNGPVGLFEHQPFDRSSVQIAQDIARLTKEGRLNSIAGGGETLAVINRAHVSDGFSYLSTGGGAFLEYIQGHELPGVKALQK